VLYDSFDDAESLGQQIIPTLKRSLSYVDTTQANQSKNTTSWLQQTSTTHSDNGSN